MDSKLTIATSRCTGEIKLRELWIPVLEDRIVTARGQTGTIIFYLLKSSTPQLSTQTKHTVLVLALQAPFDRASVPNCRTIGTAVESRYFWV